MNPDARYLATLLLALAACCLLALSLYPGEPSVSGSDLLRDAVLLRGQR